MFYDLNLSTATPVSPTLTNFVITHGIAEFSLIVEWTSDEGSKITSYTLSLLHNENTLLVLELGPNTTKYLLVGLNYNVNYSVALTATNCAGDSNSQQIFLPEGKN